MIISSRSSASLHLGEFIRTSGNILMCTIVRWFHGARAFHKPVHFILQDRVHHHVSGCCHPGNVSLIQFPTENQSLVVWLHMQPKWERLPPGAWLQTRVGFVFISMWPRFLAVQTQYGCFRGKPLAAYLNTVLPKLLPETLQMLTAFDDDTLSRWTSMRQPLNEPEMRSTAVVSALPLPWSARHSFRQFDLEPDKWSPFNSLFSLDSTVEDDKGGHPKRWSSVICRHQGIQNIAPLSKMTRALTSPPPHAVHLPASLSFKTTAHVRCLCMNQPRSTAITYVLIRCFVC